QRSRPLDPQGDGEHRLFPLHPGGQHRRGVRRSPGIGQGPVRRGNPARLGALGTVVQTALAHDLHAGEAPEMPFEIRAHARYNPAASSRLNIVPGLVGTILTMTMLIFTALSVTREIERGT